MEWNEHPLERRQVCLDGEAAPCLPRIPPGRFCSGSPGCRAGWADPIIFLKAFLVQVSAWLCLGGRNDARCQLLFLFHKVIHCWLQGVTLSSYRSPRVTSPFLSCCWHLVHSFAPFLSVSPNASHPLALCLAGITFLVMIKTDTGSKPLPAMGRSQVPGDDLHLTHLGVSFWFGPSFTMYFLPRHHHQPLLPLAVAQCLESGSF